MPSPTTLPSGPELRALLARLEAVRASCLAQLRAPRGTSLNLFAHNEIAALNADLEIVRAVHAERREYHRISAVTAWPTPVIRTTVLLSVRDILPTLYLAERVLAGALEREAHRLALARLETPRSMPVPSQRP